MAQGTYTYEVKAWTPFTIENAGTPTGVINPAYQWYENGKALNDAIKDSLEMKAGRPMGIYVYTRSVTGGGGCGLSNAITVRVTANPNMPVPSNAASTQTWTSGATGNHDAYTWSDAITLANGVVPPGCTATTTFSTTEYNLKQYKKDDNGRSYFSWQCAVNNQTWLCDNGWRFPENEDFDALVAWIKESTTSKNGKHLGESSNDSWGWGYYGYVSGSAVEFKMNGYYWSSAPSGDNAHILRYYDNGDLSVTVASKKFGQQVRCVK
jgi:uncharacterized protein (TIGR02145 family)